MPAVMKTPGVYIIEESAFPSSVVQVATAVPAFIGYTEKANNQGKSLLNKPWRITSMSDFRTYFGGAPMKAVASCVSQPDRQGSYSWCGNARLGNVYKLLAHKSQIL